MIDLGTAIQRLCIHEGISLTPYKCSAGFLTIGVGRNLITNPLTAEEKKKVGDWKSGITKDAAELEKASYDEFPNTWEWIG